MIKYTGDHTEDIVDIVISRIQTDESGNMYFPNHSDTHRLMTEVIRLDKLITEIENYHHP